MSGFFAYLLGATLGGFLFTGLFAWIASKFGLGEHDEAAVRAIKRGFVGWIGCAILAGWGAANGFGFVWTAGLWYIPGAILATLMMKKRYKETEISETFN